MHVPVFARLVQDFSYVFYCRFVWKTLHNHVYALPLLRMSKVFTEYAGY